MTPNEPLFEGSDVPERHHDLIEVIPRNAYEYKSLWQDDEKPDGEQVLNNNLSVGNVRWMLTNLQTPSGAICSGMQNQARRPLWPNLRSISGKSLLKSRTVPAPKWTVLLSRQSFRTCSASPMVFA